MEESVQHVSALAALGVDWKLFIAQLVNFGIVFFVMWKYVYVPLLKTMDSRTAKIEKGLKDAENAAGALTSAASEKAAIIAEARTESRRIIEEAAKNAEKERAETVSRSKAEVEKLLAQGKERLAAEQRELLDAVRKEAAHMVTLAVEKVLGEKLDSAADAKLVSAAVKDIR